MSMAQIDVGAYRAGAQDCHEIIRNRHDHNLPADKVEGGVLDGRFPAVLGGAVLVENDGYVAISELGLRLQANSATLIVFSKWRIPLAAGIRLARLSLAGAPCLCSVGRVRPPRSTFVGCKPPPRSSQTSQKFMVT